jgi:hypothetical protein
VFLQIYGEAGVCLTHLNEPQGKLKICYRLQRSGGEKSSGFIVSEVGSSVLSRNPWYFGSSSAAA